ncbi:hypothetical protein EJ02DRAFT_336033 [Clathrospora elynae]|uniref:Uncharacterized protein n=1 Tax=Clathrospora elynae TaxID=706981 RepID=A0A6A5T1F5_9PLEO|nr:hypothetical protein EJ02DRAFT_336033 [Clathrospora elynae]
MAVRAVTSSKVASGARSGGSLLNLGLGGSSAPLVVVGVGSATVLALGGSGSSATPKSSPVVAAPVSSVIAASATVKATVTVAPSSSAASYPPLPSNFSAPAQGKGSLSLNNLPAMPPIIDKTFSGVLGLTYGLMSGVCNTKYVCSITIAGSIQSLLVDGSKYTTSTTISAWCDNGHCYGSANPTVTATAPFVITCDKVSGNNACSGTISGIANAIFTNGKEIEAWGWLTPSAFCQAGVCTGSISALGDPMY